MVEADRALDAVGWKLLRELQLNARIPFSELGRRVGLTAPAVAERVKRMEDAGIITGYRVELNTERLGLALTAFIRVLPREGNSARVMDLARSIPEVMECYRVTGAEGSIVKVVARSVQHLEAIIDSLMPAGETVTSIVLSTPISHRVVGP